MSAFSNWNGPDCGGGASLPQIKTLEQLITQLGVVSGQLDDLRDKLNEHVTRGPGVGGNDVPTDLHTVIQQDYISRIQKAVNDVTSVQNGSTLGKLVAELQAFVKGEIGYLQDEVPVPGTPVGSGTPIEAQDVAAAIAFEKRRAVERENKIEADADGRMDTIEQKLDENAEVAGQISQTVATRLAKIRILISHAKARLLETENDLSDIYMNTSDADVDRNRVDVFKDIVYVRSNLDTLDQAIGKLQISENIDFTKWTLVNCCSRIIHRNDEDANDDDLHMDNMAVLFAVLSTDYNETVRHPNKQDTPIKGLTLNTSGPSHHNRHKAARAYVKFNNTMPWNAIIDATVTCSNIKESDDLSSVYTGSVHAQMSKTKERKRVRFGVYKSTTTDGVVHIYLGCSVEDTQAQNFDISGYKLYVCGENIIPLDATLLPPNGSVDEIAWVDVYDDSAYAFDRAYVREMYSDNYFDADGEHVLVNDEAKETLTLGTPEDPKQLLINSKERPSIFHTDGQEHKMAYLTDLAQSVYWQREVKIIERNLASVNGLKVTVAEDDATKIVVWNPDGHNVPGFYLTEPSAPNPAGYIFQDNDIALLRQSGEVNDIVADGYLNFNLVNGTNLNVPKSLITGIDWDHSKIDATDGVTDDETLNGTLVVDKAGVFGKIIRYHTPQVSDPESVESFDIKTVPALSYAYKLPIYARFTNGAFAHDGNPINVPGSFDEYVHDVTYEWSGFHAVANRDIVDTPVTDYYIQSYATWNAHHMNTATMNYADLDPDPNNADTDGWSYTDLKMEGFRAATAQDAIDSHLKDIASVQPDYTEERSVIPVDLPERPAETIPNPAYIHHRPWTGVSVLDGGEFTTPSDYIGWYVDGGDFSNMQTIPPNATVAPYNQRFKNVIIRLWRGFHSQQPELQAPINQNINTMATYMHTLRWTPFQDGDSVKDPVLSYSDGDVKGATINDRKWLYHFIPIENYKAGQTILQTFSFEVDDTENKLVFDIGYTDFSQLNNVRFGTYNLDMLSDTRPEDVEYLHLENEPFETILFVSEPSATNPTVGAAFVTRITSPRLDKLEVEVDEEIERSITRDDELQEMIETETARALAAETALGVRIDEEEAARIAADTALGVRIDEETTARIAADTAEQQARETAITNEASVRAAEDLNIQTQLNAQDELIPSTTTPTNQLVNKEQMETAITQQATRALSYDAFGRAFPTYNALVTATTFYDDGVAVTPTENDFVVVLQDEHYLDPETGTPVNPGPQTRYGRTAGGDWVFRYKINDAPMTDSQLAALNSGITPTKRAQYDAMVGAQANFPLGYVLITIDPNNPMNYSSPLPGHWSAFGQGKLLIGVGTGVDKNGVEKTVVATPGNTPNGEYQHTLTEAELPEHAHTAPRHTHGMTHDHSITAYTGSSASTNRLFFMNNPSNAGTFSTGPADPATTAQNAAANTGAVGSGAAIDTTPPYVGVYMWVKDGLLP